MRAPFPLAAIVLLLLTAPAYAAGGSLVYVAGGRVDVANADGSQARAVSPRGDWEWPSESDNGTIAALSTNGYTISEYNQQGKALLSSPIETPASTFNASADYYVNHIRISPSGSTLAYNIVNCCGISGQSTFLQPTSAGNSNWRDFTDDMINPVWVDASTANDPYVAAKNGLGLGSNGYNWSAEAAGGCCQYGIYNADNASDNGGWPSDSAIPSSDWEFEVAYTRDLKHLALLLDDSPDYAGQAQNVEIVLESVDWSNKAETTDDCTIPLRASSYSELPQGRASISYSTDGSILAWATDTGVYEANVATPGDCTAVKNSVHLVVTGGAYPYFGAASLSPATASKVPAPSTRITRASINHRTRTAAFQFTGAGGVGKLTFKCRRDHGRWTNCARGITYKRLRRGKHTFSVKAIDHRGKADSTPATKRFKI